MHFHFLGSTWLELLSPHRSWCKTLQINALSLLILATSIHGMKTLIRSFVQTHPVTFALLRFTPILPFRMRANRKYVDRSRILEAVSNLSLFIIISLSCSLSYHLVNAYLAGGLPGIQPKSLITVILLTVFCSIASTTLLFMDRCSLINEMTKTLHDVRVLSFTHTKSLQICIFDT
jgi:hypothetical protein